MKKSHYKKTDFKRFEAFCFMNGLKPGRVTSMIQYQNHLRAQK